MTARQHRSLATALTGGPGGASRLLHRGSAAGLSRPGDPADPSTSRRPRRFAAVALAAALMLGPAGLLACGDDDGDDADAGATTTEASASEATETTAGDEAESGGAADEDAAGEAVSTVFDSSVPFDDKVALIEGGEAHRADHEGYVGAANGVGGITIEPTDVAVDGDMATVTYRVLFGGNEAYADQTMDVTRVDGEWIVPTSAFCGFLAAARTPCAAA